MSNPTPTPLANKQDGLSVDQAAAELGVHPQTVRSYINSGALPVTRFGPGPRARIRIHPDDLQHVRHPSGPQDEDQTVG